MRRESGKASLRLWIAGRVKVNSPNLSVRIARIFFIADVLDFDNLISFNRRA